MYYAPLRSPEKPGMPVLGYFVVVGAALLGLMFAADAYMPKPASLSYASNFDGLPPGFKGEPSSKRPEITPQIASITPAVETTGAAPVVEPKPAAPQPAPVAAKPVKPQRKVVVHKRQRQDDDDWSGGNYNRREFAFGSRDPFSSSNYREPSWRDTWSSGDSERGSRRSAWSRPNNDFWFR